MPFEQCATGMCVGRQQRPRLNPGDILGWRIDGPAPSDHKYSGQIRSIPPLRLVAVQRLAMTRNPRWLDTEKSAGSEPELATAQQYHRYRLRQGVRLCIGLLYVSNGS